MEPEIVVVRVICGQVVIACPHNNCGGVVSVSIEELLKQKRKKVKCQGGRGLQHTVEIKLRGVDFVRLRVEEVEEVEK